MGIEADRDLTPRGPVFWTSVAVGWGVMAFGIIGALGIAKDTHPRSIAIWIVGSLVAHDLVIAPMTFVAAGVLRRLVAPRLRAPLQAALIASAALVVVSVPVVGAFGSKADNATLLPRSYATGLAVALFVVWAFTAATFAVGWKRRSQ